MTTPTYSHLCAAVALSAFVPSIASAAVLYGEAFDSSAADVTILTQPDTSVDFIDYSLLGIPESPRMVPGSAPTRGVQIRANSGDGTAAAAAANVLAGNVPISFTGNYVMSFDAWMNVPVTDNGDGTFSAPSGSTEQLLHGVGTGDSIVEARNTRFSGTAGTWGWLAGENGYGSEDSAIFIDGTEAADLGDTQAGEDGFFNDAFDAPLFPGAGNDAPANSWVEVDVEVFNGMVSVSFNGVEFFSIASTSTDGSVALGYEDPFSSITSDTAGMFGLFDNFVVSEVVPEPGSLALLAAGGLMVMRRRR